MFILPCDITLPGANVVSTNSKHTTCTKNGINAFIILLALDRKLVATLNEQ